MNPQWLFLILLLPLGGAVVNALAGQKLPRRLAEAVAVGAVALATVATLVLWPLAAGEGARATLYTWLATSDLRVPVEIVFDPLSASMTLMVTFVSTLIHLYAVGYMAGERDYARFFCLLNLFVFAMLTIVLADNLLVLFLGWEGVGFCSYGLIGYWYQQSANADAGRKAFLVTRTGDVFLGIALLWLFDRTGTLNIAEINLLAPDFGPATLFVLTLLLLGGACGKSAQLPLMTWLPDAMAGPTPVSALIHAATMVTAGVYLLARLFPLVSLSPGGMAAIAVVGAVTALYAATCALAQREIKRVLAYSTMSQVGLMFLAIGAGTVAGALFHLLTHAFFKALLFMGAGCIIHLTGENDIYRMGGVARQRLLFWTFLAGALCLAGAPLTGGFFSKDAIFLAIMVKRDLFNYSLLALGLLTTLLTVIYTFRLLYLVFAGEPRQAPEGGHHLPAVMRWTLPPLAILALFGGVLNLPPAFGWGGALSLFLGPQGGEEVHAPLPVELALVAITTLLLVVGWLFARRRYLPFRGEQPTAGKLFFLHGWQADRLVDALVVHPFTILAGVFWRRGDKQGIDGLLEGSGRALMTLGGLLRRATTGRLHSYLAGFAWGLVVLLLWMAAYVF
ncbi:MAG: NADH-quinone oxidoreductase subunit L [Desulfuromonadales bacterium]|nr:NADH-quinone oxidoreductase subunit L [Desulfuromonadales bacterium]